MRGSISPWGCPSFAPLRITERRSISPGRALRTRPASLRRCGRQKRLRRAVPGADDKALPPLREVIQRHGLAPLKRFGQHFLTDPRLIARIAAVAGDLTQGMVIEIGPGPGGLTRALLAAGAQRLVAVEYDERCLAALEELVSVYPDRLEIIAGDALKVDVARIGTPPRKIVANLPYNISTVLLTQWLAQAQAFAGLTLMFQKEVADRLMAVPRTKSYGRLSVLAQATCRVVKNFDLPPGAFHPPPKVTSTVVTLTPHETPLPCRVGTLEACTAAAFGQRRKVLRTSLRRWTPAAEALLEETGLNAGARAEELTPGDFVRLAVAHDRDFPDGQ
ncbi:MAG: 16S rRNA (adenine(1518)-N(6)/adenine(1519)-N(6))-dimethyltransferase RsmA [Alphaproteobacteria bacterium]|nr:16S rRNA (adenine(1518)-N(6)/adenine(1519)-N(6))-dimethyltransferase RsmA [Alphaproteobacteria bacterium]MCB9928638.1 16S rRNA (adenine(1518)-N(6)/adenine(1519)-N(6))-dimethyltransferase RsmA [Alphaproteobacteria bacterium]